MYLLSDSVSGFSVPALVLLWSPTITIYTFLWYEIVRFGSRDYMDLLLGSPLKALYY